MRRTKHSLSHYVLSTFDMGQLVPVGHFEVLPGDSVRMSTSCLLRLSPLMAPVMHPVTVRIHHWFVPYRIMWDEWEDFITGGPDGTGASGFPPNTQLAALVPPTQPAPTLSDKFGLPQVASTTSVSTFPFIAYNRIWNEFYRDQDLQAEVADTNAGVLNVAWEKDYFTAARPWTQKGPDVTLPIGGTAPIVPAGTGVPKFSDGVTATALRGQSGANTVHLAAGNAPASNSLAWNAPELEANLAGATAATVNDVRLAFALQRYQEARAQYGSRYTEYLRYLGIRSSDARLQRPEYLGGGRATISFSEVLKTGEGDTPVEDSPIGEMRGHGLSALRSRRWVRFFEEHGVVISVASIRPRTMYMDGIPRAWGKFTKEDYWQRELEQIGQQEVLNREVYASAASPTGVFGYQDRYSEYRHLQSYVTGDFRSNMLDWHLARGFAAEPALNASFIECNPSKRIHAVQSEDVIWGMFSHSIQARRLVGRKTIGRIF